MREWISPSCRWGSRGLPREIFRKMDANGAFWAHFLPIACWFPPKLDIPLLQVGVQGPPPGNFLEKWMQMVHSESIFCRLRVDFPPPPPFNFCLQGSAPIYVMRRIFTLSCIDAGVDIPLLQVGVQGPPPGNFLEKRTQMVHFEPIFCRLQGEFYPIKSPMSGGLKNYPLAVRMGCQGLPETIFKNRCKWCLMSHFCRLLVNIFSNFATTPRIYVMRKYFHLLIYIER